MIRHWFGYRGTQRAIGLAIAPLSLGMAPVMAQPLLPQASPVQIAQNLPQPTTTFFVNPRLGHDTQGNGSAQQPFKTLTQALNLAPPGTLIRLSAGSYNAQNGEVFPIQLKTGVTVVGDPKTKGRGVVITGGGSFLSPTFASQNVAVLGANQATLQGVTVTNSNPRGYGIWIESTRPVIRDNTLTSNTHDGISITGHGGGVVQSNTFYRNGANGISIYGTSSPEVRDNLFDNTGFGIVVSQQATPQILRNQIMRNKDGIVLQAAAAPVLRENVISNNQRDGLVAIASSQPDLGTANTPGGNVFEENGRFDLNTKALDKAISAFGNQINPGRVQGQVQLRGLSALRPLTPTRIEPNPPLAPGRMLPPVTGSGAIAASSFPVPTSLERLSRSARPVAASQPVTPTLGAPMLPTIAVRPTPGEPQPIVTPPSQLSRVTGMPIPVPVPMATRAIAPQTPVRPAGSSQYSPDAIPIPVPPPENSAPRLTPATLPTLAAKPSSFVVPLHGANATAGRSTNSSFLPPPPAMDSSDTIDRLPVPRAEIPSGSGDSAEVAIAPPPMSLRFRVLVPIEGDGQSDQVKSLVPGAFRVTSRGRVVMQVGAFNEREKAEQLIQELSNQGLQAVIEGV